MDEQDERNPRLDLGHRPNNDEHLPAVLRLPPELLSRIFLAYRDGGWPTPYSDSAFRGLFTTIMAVCSRWRAVALSDPLLWTMIDLRFPMLVEHCLRYTSDVLPRHVVLSMLDDELSFDANANTLDSNANTLDANASTLDANANTPDANANTLDANTSIAVIRLSNAPITELELYGSEVEIDQCLSDIPLHAIHSLHIHADGPWYPNQLPLPQLRRLSLENVIILRDCGLFTSCSGSLRELRLMRCSLYTFFVDPAVHLDFPSLSKFELYGSPSSCLALCRQFHRPSECRDIIQLKTDWRPWTQQHDIAQEFAQEFFTAPASRMDIQFQQGLLLVGIHNGPTTLRFRPEGYKRFAWPFVLSAMERMMLFYQPDTLSILWEADIGAETLTELCGRCTTIRTLALSGPPNSLEAVACFLGAHDTFLPELAALHLERADFTQLRGACAQNWVDGVAARRHVLKEIKLIGCTGTPPSVVELSD